MIWRRSDVDDSKQYKLHLCASKDGRRFYKLVEIGSDADNAPSEDVFLITVPAPNNLLKKGDLISISELVPLNNGQPFFVDDHGIWLAESEVKEMEADLTLKTVQWITGQTPKFPSR